MIPRIEDSEDGVFSVLICMSCDKCLGQYVFFLDILRDFSAEIV